MYDLESRYAHLCIVKSRGNGFPSRFFLRRFVHGQSLADKNQSLAG